MENDGITREELFELVWSEPTVKVANTLGISDTAVGKLCNKLQVPKPPRGYWARIAAGQRRRQPPLPAYMEESQQTAERPRAPAGVPLALRRRELFLDVAKRVGYSDDHPPFTLRNGVLTWIEPEFATSIVLALQRKATLGDKDGSRSNRQKLALERTTGDLIKLLLPVCAGTVAIFDADKARSTWLEVQAVLVRLTGELRHTVAAMAHLVRENGLSHIARGIDRGDHGWRIRYAGPPESFISATTTMHVSASEFWVQSHSAFDDRVFVSHPLSLWDLVPEDALGISEKTLPRILPRSTFGRHQEVLERMAEASSLYDMSRNALDELKCLPNHTTKLPSVLSLWLDDSQRKAVCAALDAFAQIEQRLERWESELELERARVAEEILDVRPGDVVVAHVRNSTTRMLVEHITGSTTESYYLVRIDGRRFTRDGKPGKRRDTVHVKLPFEQGPGSTRYVR